MKILLVSTSDSGGAGVACKRLLRALRMKGEDARMLVLDKRVEEDGIYEWVDTYQGSTRKLKKVKKSLAQFFGRMRSAAAIRGRAPEWDSFSSTGPSLLSRDHPLLKWADVVHLHWCAGFWSWSNFRSLKGRRVFWTLHDLNPATGGCHYPGGCQQYIGGCSRCPQLEGTRNQRIVRRLHRIKKRALKSPSSGSLAVISPSKWIESHARRSLLFRDAKHYVVPNCLDPAIFRPLEKEYCRDVMNIPQGRKVALFAAQYLGNHRKGMDILLAAIRLLSEDKKITVYAAGLVSGKLPEGIISLGNIGDERLMAIAYNAADVFLLPSREDNLPNTVVESQLCGTPVVAFATGGIPEMIEEGSNGCLADVLSPASFAQSIRRSIEIRWDRVAISNAARSRYAQDRIAELHLSLYRQ
jgi:glycosyltransferase involved in cell wall biosynthesis